ncbi:RNA polymerase sigma factor [Bacteroides sp.]
MKTKTKHTVDTLYKEYADEMFAYALGFKIDREMAMDAIHDVFCRLCAYDEVDLSIENHRYYLFRALRNQIIDIYKKTRREDMEMLTDDRLDEIPYKVRVSIEDEFIVREEQAEIIRKVDSLLESLNSRQRELIYLYFIQECSYEEISGIMHMNVAACRKSVYRALLRLKQENKLMLFYLILSVNVG